MQRNFLFEVPLFSPPYFYVPCYTFPYTFSSYDTESLNKVTYDTDTILIDPDHFLPSFQKDSQQKTITGVQKLYLIGKAFLFFIKIHLFQFYSYI